MSIKITIVPNSGVEGWSSQPPQNRDKVILKKQTHGHFWLLLKKGRIDEKVAEKKSARRMGFC